MNSWLQLVGLVLLSSTKFLFAPSTVAASGYTYLETLIITTLGGWFGVLVFYYFGRVLVDLILRKYINKDSKKVKAKFTFSNKLIVKTKSKYGIIGLAFISPVTISIPVGSILAARYYSREKMTVPYLLLSIVFWSFTLSTISIYFKELF
jgi:membrane protein YqaA with SNARE-associated domain